MKVYDNYEISPCRQYKEHDSPGRFYYEVCEPAEADVWTLYGHIDGQGVEAIGNFRSNDAAERTYYRITGQEFTGFYKADARLRVMHAGPKLLQAAEAAWNTAANHEKLFLEECKQLRAAIAEATGDDRARGAKLPPDPEGMNDRRAEWAGKAIAVFQRETGTDDEDALGDLIADLIHWADRNNYDFEAALFRAQGHYEAETGGEVI